MTIRDYPQAGVEEAVKDCHNRDRSYCYTHEAKHDHRLLAEKRRHAAGVKGRLKAMQ